ncbi:hypothetical protein B0J14DRAFT_622108 [Halenospora varia]|nr:hypothetical protein B0J14DRAFT_622108 [Halenospora varia]
MQNGHANGLKATTPSEWVHNQGGPGRDTLPKPANWIPVHEEPLYTPRKIRIIIIGAGFSGLMAAHKYPGVACDVPAHIYTFTWGPNPDWSHFYAQGGEIRQHIKRIAKEYDLEKNIKFNAKVTEATWMEDKGKWHVKVDLNGTIVEDEAEVVINASGVLNNWHWPAIPGLKNFKGHLCHSAVWDHSYDYTNKTVAVIGNGSSAIQIVATWISSNFAADHTIDGKNFAYSTEQRKEFQDPEKLLAYRKKIEHDFNKLYRGLEYGTPEHEFFSQQPRQIMTDRLNGNAEMAEKLIPSWSFGCRRLSPGDGYLEALQKKNVTPVFSAAAEITADGIVDAEGKHHQVDAIICATGFDVSFAKQWPVNGRNGKLLQEEWAEDPQSYFSVCARNFPNFFFILGPNSPVGNGSLIPQMEWAGMYAVKWADKIARENIHSIDPKQEAVDDFNVYTQEYLKRTVYTSHCRSWYKNNKVDGPVTAMWAGSPMHFKDMMSTQRGEDFEIKYNSPNRFKFFGNGTDWRDAEGADLSYYLRTHGRVL